MFGLSRKKTPRSQEASQPEMPAVPPLVTAEADEPDALRHSFRVLEIATLTLDSIAHGLGEARALARSAARPDGAAQRGLIAARYAFLKEDIERRSAEQALGNSEQIAIALGAGEDGRQGSLMTQELPGCAFRTAEEARTLIETLEHAICAVEDEAMRIRAAAGHVADQIVKADSALKAAMPEAGTAPQIIAPAKPAASRGRRAA
jgi:hypothetical protein